MAPFGCTVCTGRGCYRRSWRCGALCPWYSMERAADCCYLFLHRWSNAVAYQCSFPMHTQGTWKSGANIEYDPSCWGWGLRFCIPYKFPIARPESEGGNHVSIEDWGMNKVLEIHVKAVRQLAGDVWWVSEYRHLSSVGKEKNQRGYGRERWGWAL